MSTAEIDMGVHGVDDRVLDGAPVPALLVDGDGLIVTQNERLDILLGGSLVGRAFSDVFSASTGGDDHPPDHPRQHRLNCVDVRVSTCDPAPSGIGRLVFTEPVNGEQERLATARWLHDRVVPLAMAAGLRVDLALLDAADDQHEHLTAASTALTELGARIRETMSRTAGA